MELGAICPQVNGPRLKEACHWTDPTYPKCQAEGDKLNKYNHQAVDIEVYMTGCHCIMSATYFDHIKGKLYLKYERLIF